MARKKIKKQKKKINKSDMTKQELEDFLDDANELYKLVQSIHRGLVYEENKLLKNPINDDSD